MSFRTSLPSVTFRVSIGAACAFALAGCDSSSKETPAATSTTATATASAPKPPESHSSEAPASGSAAASGSAPAESATAPTPPAPKAAKVVLAHPVATVTPSPDDPLKGKFTLDDAVKGLPKTGKLFAILDTEKGKLECELWPDKAPITVANFVGLARGVRPWKNPDGKWVKKPLYDGTVFHRIIKGFMIQGGDPRGNGSGDPGYVIPDEIWENGSHDQRGLLCMANRGPNTNGSQFFILDRPSTFLDNNYTIFGKCSPDSVIETIASNKVSGDRAIDPPKIKKATVERRKD